MNWVKAIGILLFQITLGALFMGFVVGISYVLAFHPLWFVGTLVTICLVWAVCHIKGELDNDEQNRAASKKEWAAYLVEQKAENAIFDERLREARAKLKELEDEYSAKDQ